MSQESLLKTHMLALLFSAFGLGDIISPLCLMFAFVYESSHHFFHSSPSSSLT